MLMLSEYNGYFLVSGVGFGSTELSSFDAALIDSCIGDFNLVRLSSILPKKCMKMHIHENNDRELLVVPKERNDSSYFSKMQKGSLLPIAYSSMTSCGWDGDEPLRGVTASVAVGIPIEDNLCGLIMEYHGESSWADESKSNSASIHVVSEMVKEGFVNRRRGLLRTDHISSSYIFSGVPNAYFGSDVKWASEKYEYVTVFSGVVLCESRIW